jgi:hypothetical protein
MLSSTACDEDGAGDRSERDRDAGFAMSSRVTMPAPRRKIPRSRC